MLLKLLIALIVFPIIYMFIWIASVNLMHEHWPSYEQWQHLALACFITSLITVIALI